MPRSQPGQPPEHPNEKSNNLAWGVGFGVVAVIAVVGGPPAYRALEDGVHPPSKIVEGVPGQVEQHWISTNCVARIGGLCAEQLTSYHLNIEQCPADVEAARQGRQTTSFDPDPHERYTTCYADSVAVSATVYKSFADGDSITFSGPIGEHLFK